jgi:CheY-like chemotaxis protein
MQAKQKILLVEDHEDTSELMVILLNQLNYEVATAASISGVICSSLIPYSRMARALTSVNISANGTIPHQFSSIRPWRLNTTSMRR